MNTSKSFATISTLRSSIQKDIEAYELPFEKEDVNKAFFEPNNNTFEAIILQEGKPQKILIPAANMYPFYSEDKRKISVNASHPFIGKKTNKVPPIYSLKDYAKLNLQN